MYMLILSVHIFVAALMTTAIIGVMAAAQARRETKAYVAMLSSFGATVASGIGLLVVSPTGLGRFCAMMSLFTLSVFVARSYYRKRIQVSQTL